MTNNLSLWSNNIKSGESLMITVSVQKSQKPLSPSKNSKNCALNDKSLAGHDIIRRSLAILTMGLIKIKLQKILQKIDKTCSLTTQIFLQYNQGELFYNLCHCTNQDSSLENNTDKPCPLCNTQI